MLLLTTTAQKELATRETATGVTKILKLANAIFLECCVICLIIGHTILYKWVVFQQVLFQKVHLSVIWSLKLFSYISYVRACKVGVGGVRAHGFGQSPTVFSPSFFLFPHSLLPHSCPQLFFLHTNSNATLNSLLQMCVLMVDLRGWLSHTSYSHCVCPNLGPSVPDLIWLKKSLLPLNATDYD